MLRRPRGAGHVMGMGMTWIGSGSVLCVEEYEYGGIATTYK